MVCQSSLYDANINVDVIISYGWLGHQGMDIRCRRHGLEITRPNSCLWVGGVKYGNSSSSNTSVNGVEGKSGKKPPPEKPEWDPPGGTEDYTVRWPVVHEIIKGLNVEPQRDCFAADGNQRFPHFWTKGENAMVQDWSTGEILWFNPPGVCGQK